MICSSVRDSREQFRPDPWFGGLPDALQQALMEQAVWQTVEPHQALTHGGDTSGGIVGLAEGTAIIVPAVGPADAGPIHLFLAPLWFGLMPLSQGRPRAISAVAQSTCRVARVSQQRTMQLLGCNPGWWQHMHDLALSHFLLAAQTAADLHINDSRRRLCAVLLRLGNCRHEGDGDVELPVGQQDLATIANMSRQTVGQVLKLLAADGLVDWGYRKITLSDPAGLRRIASE